MQLRAGVSEWVKPASARKPETGLRMVRASVSKIRNGKLQGRRPAVLTRPVFRWLAVVWVLGLVIMSLQPFRPEGTRGRAAPKHQIEHVLIFAATGVVLLSLARGRTSEWRAALGVVGLATAIELAQLAIYRMPVGFEWWDVREDSIGIALGLIVIRYTRVRSLLLQAGSGG